MADGAPGSKDVNFPIQCISPKGEAERKGGVGRIAEILKYLNKVSAIPYIFEIRCLIFFLAATNSSLAVLNRTDMYSAKTR